MLLRGGAACRELGVWADGLAVVAELGRSGAVCGTWTIIRAQGRPFGVRRR
jgi:hypothetical protein